MSEPEQLSEFAKSLKLSGGLHLSALAISLLAIVLIPFIGRCLSAINRRRMMWLLVAFAIGQELVDYGNRASLRELTLIKDLPLHLCQYSLIIATFGLITRKRVCFEFAYLIGTTGALQAMITPAPTRLDNMTYLVTFFTHHAILVLFPIWNIVVDGMVTTRGAILRTMLFVNLMGIPVATVNWLIGSNYMYLCTKPGVDSPFLVGDWPWYLLGLEVVALLLMAIASVPMLYLRREGQAGQILNSKNQKSNSEFV